jgi:hypothetical protein
VPSSSSESGICLVLVLWNQLNSPGSSSMILSSRLSDASNLMSKGKLVNVSSDFWVLTHARGIGEGGNFSGFCASRLRADSTSSFLLQLELIIVLWI